MKLRVGHWLGLGILLALPGLFRLRFDVDVLNVLPAHVPAVQGLRIHQKHFSDANELIITLQAADPDVAEQTARSLAEKLRARPDLVRGVMWQPPWMENPAQSAELIAYLWMNQPPEAFRELTNRLSGSNAVAVLKETQERLATTFSPSELARLPYDPFNLMQLPNAVSSASNPELFASSDGTFRLMFVQAAMPLTNYRECARWLSRVQAVVGPSERIRYTGAPVFTAEIAGGMERDMSSSSLGTIAIISALFWWAHRRWRPLLWLIALLGLVLLGTLSLGGWIIGKLNVVSLGFAAILLGLGVDYALMLYQEWRAAPEQSPREVRRHVAPGIFWSVMSTAGAFLLLNLSGLPGLGQLGTLVGCGVALAAIVMVAAYLAPLRNHAETALPAATPINMSVRTALGWLGTGVFVAAGVWILFSGLPKVDHSSEPLRPRASQAFAALEEVKARMGGASDPWWIIFRGTNETEVAERMRAVEPLLEKFVAAGKLERFDLPTAIWPVPAHHTKNRGAAEKLAGQAPALVRAALESGFTTNSLFMTESILGYFSRGNVITPTNFSSQWMLGKLISRGPNEALALGMAHPTGHTEHVQEVTEALLPHGALLAGWDILGPSLLEIVRKDLWFVMPPVIAIVGLALVLAFRRAREVMLAVGAGALSAITLLAVMRIAGWSWNLMNLLAVPLLLGTGVDHAIHMLLALRRNGDDWTRTHRTTGRALILCGCTTVAGFGSLAWSSNAGLASLGKVCATGIAAVTVVSVFLLPVWWRRLAPKGPIDQPSALYRAAFWQAGMFAVKVLPAGLSVAIARCLGRLYWRLAPARREIVINNLMPALGNRASAEKSADELFDQFSVKLVDLWRFESGQPTDKLFSELIGWEHFTQAHARGKGVLLVTPHLGNWEFGGPLLVQRGIELHVVTLTEPGAGFTELRQEFRARWGIETLVIGHDTFAVIEVIKRLQDGATVALLVDRPPASSAVNVKLFGQPFKASVAAAELARASGCAVVPVILPRTPKGYAARVLPEIAYDRAALGKRDAREEFTAEIMRAFEPAIRQYITQWYHFVPVWPERLRS